MLRFVHAPASPSTCAPNHSAARHGHPEPHIPPLCPLTPLPGVLKYKRMAEQELEGSGLPYVIVRPNRLTDGGWGCAGWNAGGLLGMACVLHASNQA